MRFNIEIGYELVNDLINCLDIVEAENEKLQHNFQSLNATFKDAYYQEFAAEFEKGDKNIETLKNNIHSVATSILRYTNYLSENENV